MRLLIEEIPTAHTPESLAAQLLAPASGFRSASGNVVLLRTSQFDLVTARYSFVTARPFLTFRSFGSRCEITQYASRVTHQVLFGNPWHLLDALMLRFELLEEIDSPFPLGGAFGYWGYDLKNFTEPKLPRRAVNDLELPDCHVGFYDSLVVFDHRLGKVCAISTGLAADGSRSESRAAEQLQSWKEQLSRPPTPAHDPGTAGVPPASSPGVPPGLSGAIGDGGTTIVPIQRIAAGSSHHEPERRSPTRPVGKYSPASSRVGDRRSNGSVHGPNARPQAVGALPEVGTGVTSNISRAEFISIVERVQTYIRAGDIYQANLSHRLTAPCEVSGWDLFQELAAVSPSPFAAFLECDTGSRQTRFALASSSPEQFLRLSGAHVVTRPIKGTRPRAAEATRDAQLAYELQTSPKELAELVMITDLLRNDLGKICDYGSVQVPELARLEKFAQVQHLVSTVEGRLRPELTHFAAFASCFPGGSVTGAPKFRALEVIDELEPVSRGPYCGAIGYLGFNRESQLSITIRTAVCQPGVAHFNVGAGIVADSDPEAEYAETLAKARGFSGALERLQSRFSSASI